MLVDDGSADASPALCTRLKKEDDRIRILHKANGGLSSARNAGLTAAKGEYIGFCDADDTAAPTMYEALLDKIERYACDFVFCDLTRVEPGKPPALRSVSLHGGYYDRPKIKRCVFPQLIMRDDLEYGPLLSVCVCLYRKSFLRENQLLFDETVRYSEDNLFSARVGFCARSFFYLKNEGLYEYYKNPGSITTSRTPEAWESYKRMYEKLCGLFQSCTAFDFSKQLDLHLIHYACAALGQAADLPKDAQKAEIDKILSDAALQKALKNTPPHHIPFKLHVQLLCMKYRCTPLVCLWLQRRARYA